MIGLTVSSTQWQPLQADMRGNHLRRDNSASAREIQRGLSKGTGLSTFPIVGVRSNGTEYAGLVTGRRQFISREAAASCKPQPTAWRGPCSAGLSSRGTARAARADLARAQ